MNIIVYSDLHLYNHHRLLVNSETALGFLSYLKEYALENKIDTIISAGDFFHTKAHAYAPHVVQGLLRIKDIFKSNIKQYMIVGNHDMANPNNTMNSILFTYSDYAKIVPDYFYLDIENVRVHMLSYSTQMFESFILAEDKKNILIGHLDIIGFIMPNGFESNAGFRDDTFKQFDLVISGHYHMFQNKDKIVYVGSPYQTNFSEKDQTHGFLVVNTETMEWKFVEYLGAPKYKVIEINSPKDLVKSEIENNFVKIKLLSDKVNKNQLRNTLFEMGAASTDIIAVEDVKEIEKYYDKSFGVEPQEIAKAYLEAVANLDLDKQKLSECFSKIEEISNNISEYEV
jgi:DNA repair exonuclease SbcCD nuclease subunit